MTQLAFVLLVLFFFGRSAVAAPKDVELISQSALQLKQQGRLQEAVILAARAVAMGEKEYGKDTANFALLANRLASLYRLTGRFDQAESYYHTAIAIREKSDPNLLADSLNDLGLLYWDTGRYNEAEPLFKKSLELYTNRLGADHEYVATSSTNLALLYRDMARFDEAERFMLLGKTIREKLTTPTRDDDVANSLNNLAGLLRERGRYTEAETLARQAIELRSRNPRADPLELATSKNVLAETLRLSGRYSEAEQVLKQVLEIRRAKLGQEDVKVASSLNSLGGVYEGQGRLAEAESTYKLALQIREKRLRSHYPNHPDIAVSEANLGGLYKSQYRYTEAEPLLRDALKIREKSLGSLHPDYLKSLVQLADLVRARGRKSEADQLFNRALAIRKSAIKQIEVHFATNRAKLIGAKSLAFGSERAQKLTYGRASVWVPTELTATETKVQPAGLASINQKTSANETTEIARLNIRDKIELARSDFAQSATQTLNLARLFPRQALLFIHGFNVSFDNALKRAAQVAYDLEFDGPVLLFAWPSRGGDTMLSNILGVLDYTADSKSAEVSGEFIRQFIEDCAEAINADKMHVIAHSMGNKALLEALKVSADRGTLSKARIGEIILASPDVEHDRFGQLAESIRGTIKNMTLYASSSDRALMISQRFWRGGTPVGYVPSGSEPTLAPNVESLDITAAGDTFFGLNHDIFATNATITSDMRSIFARSAHPPDQRTPQFERKLSQEGQRSFWLYRPLARP